MSKAELVKRWLKKAENDLLVAKHVLADRYPDEIEITEQDAANALEKAGRI